MQLLYSHKKSKEPKVKLKVPEVTNPDVLKKQLISDSLNSSEEGIIRCFFDNFQLMYKKCCVYY